MNIIEIGAQIRAARKKNKLTQSELAKLVGMSRSRLSLLETGDAFEIGLQKILRICMVLKLELNIAPLRVPTWEELNKEHEERVSKGLEETSKILKTIQA